MKTPLRILNALTVASILSTVTARGQTLFLDTFDTTPASSWAVNGQTSQDQAVIGFDYSSVGIPSAPHSTGGTTIGAQLKANRPGGTATLSGVSISPVSFSVQGDYQVRYDMWANFQGPLDVGGAGSTQITGGGIMTAGTVFHSVSSGDGLWFAATGDGQSASDYRVYYRGTIQSTTTLYAAGSLNNSSAYYNSFGGVTAPQAQKDQFAQQTGTTSVGAFGMQWHDVGITKAGNIVTWDIDGKTIATVDTSAAGVPAFGGNNIFLVQADTASSQVSVANDPVLFGLVDNVRVTQTPEPSTIALIGLGGLLVAGICRRKA
jgi:hypothetical protein